MTVKMDEHHPLMPYLSIFSSLSHTHTPRLSHCAHTHAHTHIHVTLNPLTPPLLLMRVYPILAVYFFFLVPKPRIELSSILIRYVLGQKKRTLIHWPKGMYR